MVNPSYISHAHILALVFVSLHVPLFFIALQCLASQANCFCARALTRQGFAYFLSIFDIGLDATSYQDEQNQEHVLDRGQ